MLSILAWLSLIVAKFSVFLHAARSSLVDNVDDILEPSDAEL